MTDDSPKILATAPIWTGSHHPAAKSDRTPPTPLARFWTNARGRRADARRVQSIGGASRRLAAFDARRRFERLPPRPAFGRGGASPVSRFRNAATRGLAVPYARLPRRLRTGVAGVLSDLLLAGVDDWVDARRAPRTAAVGIFSGRSCPTRSLAGRVGLALSPRPADGPRALPYLQ